MAEAGRSSSESSLVKCFVGDGPWVTPSLNHKDEQESKGEDTGRQPGEGKVAAQQVAE